MGFFANVLTPALPTLVRMELRGLPTDLEKLKQLRDETEEVLIAAERRIGALTQEFHAKRLARIEEGIASLQQEEKNAADTYSTRAGEGAPQICRLHPDYRGLTRRAKCAGCADVFARAEGFRSEVRSIRGRASRGRAKLRALGKEFKVGSDAHWRELLFDAEIGFGLKPTAYTAKKREPQVDDDAIEKLQRRHPEIELLTLRMRAKKAASRLSNRLSIEPDAQGRTHYAFSVHRSPGRLASGADAEESDKFRDSEGNALNVPEKDRVLYVAPPGMVCLASDWSQIEARVTAWLAREWSMLDAWQQGRDVHAENGLALWRKMYELEMTDKPPSLERVDEDTCWFAGEQRTFRYIAKRMTHGWHYGMEGQHTEDEFGLPRGTGIQLLRAYLVSRPRLAEWQQAEIAQATRSRYLVNEWGRKLPFFGMKQRKGVWELADKKTALSFRPQTDVFAMLMVLMPTVEEAANQQGGELLNAPHDGYWTIVPEQQVQPFALYMKKLMEREWEEFGVLEKYGKFRCPVEVAVGANFAKASEANPQGLKKLMLE